MEYEQIIIKEIKNGQPPIYEKIFHEYYNSLVTFANRFLADTKASEDVVQGVFIYFWENSGSIQIKQSIKGYLFQAVKNSCFNQLRALKIKDKHEILYLEAVLETANEELLNETDIIEDIKKALSKLPKQMYRVFYKKYFQELSVKEIAKEMSISENTVKVQLYKGRHTIREFLRVAN